MLAKNLLATGYLSDDDLKNRETLLSKLIKYCRQYEVILVIDHRDSLLDHATQFSISGDLDLAIMLYATNFEHELNSIIDCTLIKKCISTKSKN